MIPSKKLILLSTIMLCVSPIARAGDIPFTLEDRDRLTRIEARLEGLESSLEKRFEQVDRRFDQVDIRFTELREDMNKRFELFDKRFEQVDKRFGQMFNFVWILATIFTAITAATIGFAVCDRRTMVRPFETKVKQIEERIEGVDKDTVNTLVKVLKEFAIMDVKMGDILKKFHL
ncbi:MAG: hypothetical protein HZB37_08590 [Planctomycetes bacterium]|nr:hypothetical protein [Planctomycetota bacterium]